ncbi:hypothetical protein CLU79DRAFT_736556 [Phycomyces nitens]|nr:hypothetical protein CLU79DRAFT_736556 [Phycomyces nitens]
MGSNTSKPVDAQNNEPIQAPQRRRGKLGSIRQPKNKISKGNLNRREPTVLSFDTPPLPASCTRPKEPPKSTPPASATKRQSAEQLPTSIDPNHISLGDPSDPNHISSFANPRISLASQTSYVGMTQSREPRQRIPRGRNPQNRYSQRVYSTISCATNDSGQSSWMLSGGLFSQIDSTSSIITAITDYSNISRRSMFAQDWPKEDPSKMVISTPSSSSTTQAPLSTTPPPVIDQSTLPLLEQLINSPNQEFSILKNAFAKSQQTGYAHHQEEAYKAALSWSHKTDSLTARVWVARCQIEGWGTSADPLHGFRTLKTIAEADDFWEAFYPLAMCYLNGVSAASPQDSSTGVTTRSETIVQPIDRKAAFFWLKATAEIDFESKGSDPEIKLTVAKAQYRVAVMLFKGAEKMAQDPVGALQWFVKSADNGDKYAQYIAGIHYERGMFTEKDIPRAKAYLLQSANQDFGDAEAALGIACINEGQDKEGMKWLKRATQKDNPRALLQLGLMYETGQGVEQNNAIAVSYYKSAANRDDARAQYVLGLAYYMGNLDLQKNLGRAEKYLTLSAKAGYAPSQRILGIMYTQDLNPTDNEEGQFRKKDIKVALGWFRRAAYQGDIRALGLLGSCFENGQGVASNFEIALEYYRKGARINGPFQDSAQLALAQLLHRMERNRDALAWFTRASSAWSPEQEVSGPLGHRLPCRTAALMVARYQLHGWTGSPKRPKAAFDILFHLARQSELDSHAHYWLAACYEEGVQGRCEKDLTKAFEHYLIAGKAEDVDAEFQVALMLSNGQGVEQDRAAAFYWYEKAANKDHKTALYSLGLYYAKGMFGVEKDLFKARSCFKKSARLGVVSAMTTLATICKMSSNGDSPEGQEQQRQTVYWYEKAAQYGDPVAQRELAILYDAGIGVSQSYPKALVYLQKSASQKDTQATLLLGNYYQNGHAVDRDLNQAIELYLEAAHLGSSVAPFAAAQVYHSLRQYEDAYIQYKIAANDCRLTNARVSKASKLMVARYALSYVPLSGPTDSTGAVQDVDRMSKKDAFKMLYSLATEDQFESSYFWLADCFYLGNGVAVNYPQAMLWYKRSVKETKDAEAMAKIGTMYEHGQGVEINEATAIDYYKQSADLGSAEGQYKMGLANWRGICNVPINLGDAVLWFTWSAKQKYADSLWALGQMALENGDQDVATEWWHKAIALDHIPSMRSLASILLQTSSQKQFQNGVTPDAHLEHAMELLANAFRHGDAESLVDLGKLHQQGIVTLADSPIQPGQLTQRQQEEQELATRCFEEAAAMGHVESMFLAAESWHIRQQYAAALGFYEKAVQKGHIQSRAMVAHYQLKGLGGMEADPSSAYKDLIYCAEKECLAVVFNLLGQCNEHGLGTPKDSQLALEWYLRSSNELKDSEAMFRVGQLIAQGHASIKDNSPVHPDIQALEWYRLATETSDHGHAHLGLGLYYTQGIKDKDTVLLETNPMLAIDHLRKAAGQCIPEAMFELGQILLNMKGSEPERTIREAVKWLECAAQLGSREAQRELGKLYNSGQTITYQDLTTTEEKVVVAQDFAKSFDYFCRAAQQKDKTASLFLGIYHENGIHVQTNTDLAKEWYRIAVALGKQQSNEGAGGWWLAELALAQLLHQEPMNRQEAYPLFEAAHAHAPLHQKKTPLIMLARYRLHGWGNVPVNLEEGALMLVRLADEGEVKVFLEVAQCYEFGIGVEQDFQKAFEWYERVVNLKISDDIVDEEDLEDQAEASFRLAEFYKSGLVVSADLKKANYFYRMAANKGSLKASESLKEQL